jgi:peptidoglycan-associated lipoprotein
LRKLILSRRLAMTRLNALFIVIIGAVLFMSAGCGPKYPACETDEHCKEHNEFCVDKICRQCRDDANCNVENPCKICGPSYTCEKKLNCCTSDLDCPGGKCWKSVAGSPTGQCAQCVADTDCPQNQKCVAGRCAPKGECESDAQCPAGKKCVDNFCVVIECKLEAIFFDFDEYIIKSEERPTLEKNYNCIKERGQSITVEGHCDERGTDEYNLALGKRRATAAKDFLAKLGVKSSNIETISYGEERPVCMDHEESCWKKNRRAEFIFK